MNSATRVILFSLFGTLLVFTGCASKKKTAKQIDALQAQVGSLSDEVVRLDQALQETRASIQATETRRQEFAGGGAVQAAGPVYRTPSGFELPSADIQRALKNAGYYDGSVDGKIGPATRDAVKSFQRDHGLTADGVVGRSTWGKLKVYLSGTGK